MSENHKSALRVALGSLRVKHHACGWRLSEDGLALHGTHKGRAVTLAPSAVAYKASTDDGDVVSSSLDAGRAMSNLIEHLNGSRAPLSGDDVVAVESRGASPVVDAWHDAMMNMAHKRARLALLLWQWQLDRSNLYGFVRLFERALQLDVTLMPGSWSVILSCNGEERLEEQGVDLLATIGKALESWGEAEDVCHRALILEGPCEELSADTRAVATVDPAPKVVAIDDYTARGLAMADALRRLADKMQAGEVRALLVTGAVMEDGELCNWHLVEFGTVEDGFTLCGRAGCSQARLVELVRARLEGDEL